MRYFDQFLARLEALRAKYRRPTMPVSGKHGRFRPQVEGLENRVVPSTIEWVNKGSTTSDTDNFNSVFGDNADTARAVVEAAIDAWERVIVDFGWEDVPILGGIVVPAPSKFELTLSMDTSGAGGNGAAASTNLHLDGRPMSSTIVIDRGGDADGDGLGDGVGWFLDPTPTEHSEFLGNIINAFAGDAPDATPTAPASPAFGLGDLYTVVVVEMTHSLGITSKSGSLFQSRGYLTDTGVADNAEGGGVGRFYVFDGPSIDHLMTSFDSGAGDFGAAVHSAGLRPNNGSLSFNGTFWRGAEDTGNAIYEFGRRYLVPNTMRLVLADSYDYFTIHAETFGTFYSALNEATGEVLVRGGAGISDDTITISQSGDKIKFSVDVGNDVPGTGPLSGALSDNLSAFETFYPRSQVNSIRIEAGEGDDTITIDEIPAFVDLTVDGGSGKDQVTIRQIGALSSAVIDGGDDDDTITLEGDLDDDFRSDVEVRGGAGNDTLNITDNNDEGGNDYTLTSSSLTKRLWLNSITFSGISDLVLTTSEFDDTIDVNSTSYDLVVRARGGADTFNIGNGNYNGRIFGTVLVTGSSFAVPDGEIDTLNIHDDADTSLDNYTITDRTLTSSNAPSSVLTFGNMDAVVLNANDRPNTITINGVKETTDLTINANGGADTFIVGGGNYTKNILRPLTLNGDGTDTLTIDDDQDQAGVHVISGVDFPEQHIYTLSSSTFVKTTDILGFDDTDPTLTFNLFARVTLSASGTTGRELDEGEFGSIISVQSMAAGARLFVHANGGRDRIIFDADAADVAVIINGGLGNDAIDVNRTGTGASIAANGNDHDDTFGVGNGNYESNIRGAVSVNGGQGENHLQIDDSTNDITGALGDHRFGTSPDDPSLGQYVLFRNAKSFPESETLSFQRVQSVELLANDFSNDILVDGTVAGATYTLRGNGGNDDFFVGNGEYDANIRGPLTIDGGGGASDDITVDDTTGGDFDNYTLNQSTLTKPFRTLTYLSVENFTLNAGPGDNAINVHHLLSSVSLEINAGGGDDRINLGLGDFDTQLQGPITVDAGEHRIKDTITIFDSTDGPGGDSYTFARSADGTTFAKPTRTLTFGGAENFVLHASPNADAIAIDALPDLVNLTINAGPPTVAPGDSLSITGTPESIATITTGLAGEGEVLIGGLTVDFTGIERPLTAREFAQIRLAAGNRFDDLWIRDDGSGLTSVSEHADPAAQAALRVTDVDEFVLDGSAIDVDSNWTIEAAALNAPGLARLELRTGSGTSLVNDHILNGPATAATIAVRNLAGGTTQHLIYGNAAKITAAAFEQGEQGSAKFAILQAVNSAGEIAYVLEDEGVNNLFLIDRQADVNLFLAVPDARLFDGGGQLVVTGTNMTGFSLPAAEGARMRVLPVQRMTVVIEATVFPNFQFDPLYGLDMSPIGTFHVRPVFRVADSGAGSLREAIEQANAAPADGTAVVFFALDDTDSAFVDVDSHLGGDVNGDAFVLAPLTELPALTRGNTIINGASQQAATGDTNPFGPEIVLSGHRAAAGESIHGLVSLYRLDGSVEDVAGDNEPSATAGLSFVDGRIGQGATLAPGGFIDIPHSENLANQVFTLSAWVRPDGPGPNHDFFGSAIIAKGLSPALGGNQVVSAQITYSTQLNRFLFGFGNFFSDATRIISAETFAPGQFYHVAGTYDGADFRLYVNGRLQGEKALVKTIDYDPTIPWTIGSAAPPFRAVGFPRTLNGVVDEVGIYNRALSAEEIASLATASAGGPIDGLHLASSSNIVHGLNIQSFSGNGVLVAGDDNALTGNFIGTSATGDETVANGGYGVRIIDSRGNLIGGTTEADRNVISGNAGSGVAIQGGSKNIIRGNFIGTTADGMTALGNEAAGIAIRDSAANTIGGDTAEARNIISANATGVSIVGPLAGANRVSANYIGVAADGGTDLGNFDGVFVAGGAAGNVIGGSLPGERNVIAGNFRSNIFLSSMGTRVQGNYIGTDSTGTRQVESDARSVTGIRLEDDKYSLIGGLLPEEGNLISGHEIGIQFNGQWVAGGLENTRVQGNRIGTTADGEQILANRWGLYMSGHVDSDGVTHLVRNVLIGGTEDGAGNLISGNANAAIIGFGPGVQGLRIEGNRIGTDIDGDEIVRNGSGIVLNDASGITIGGAVPLAGNLIAGNSGNGITIVGGSGHIIQANSIGTNADGNFKLGNGGRGISIENSFGTTIGGSLKFDGNVVAFNGDDGIALNGVSGGIIEGNLVGTDRLGRFLGNGGDGVSLQGTTGVRIAGNAVGANAGTGLRLVDSSRNDVLDNAIGTTRLVKPFLPNGAGLRIQGGEANVIVGNTISGNIGDGVQLTGTTRNTLSSNRIGVDGDGNTPIGNGTGAVLAEASLNTFENNTISGNLGSGVVLAVGSEGNRFFGNRIGTTADGAFTVGNGGHGLLLGKGARSNFIGIERDEHGNDNPMQGNTVAFNTLAGIAVIGDAAVGNSIRGNSIHSNGGLGIDLGGDLVTSNDYGDPKAKPPIPPDLDIGPNNLQNYPDIRQVTATVNGTRVLGQLHSVPGTQFIIDFYANSAADPSGHGEGRRWLGSKTITTGNEGVGAITFDILPEQAFLGEFISATATNTVTGDTSELSTAVVIVKRGDARDMQANETPTIATDDALAMASVESQLSEPVARLGCAVLNCDVRTSVLPRLTLCRIVGDAIWLNVGAAGWGWSIDPTPQNDNESTTTGNQCAHGCADLPSLSHEIGEQMSREYEFGIMPESLAARKRPVLGGLYGDQADSFRLPEDETVEILLN